MGKDPILKLCGKKYSPKTAKTDGLTIMSFKKCKSLTGDTYKFTNTRTTHIPIHFIGTQTCFNLSLKFLTMR